VTGQAAMQRTALALTLALGRAEFSAALIGPRDGWRWDEASGTLSGVLDDGTRWAARLGRAVPPFPGLPLTIAISAPDRPCDPPAVFERMVLPRDLPPDGGAAA
jgi:hypothetical protein